MTMASAAGVVLAGGRSLRMGSDKAAVPWGGTTLVGRTCEVLAAAGLDPVVVVSAAGQPLPGLPSGVEVCEDPQPDLGPVAALASGLLAVGNRAPISYVVATDLPLLDAAVVRRTVAELVADPGCEVVVPMVADHPQLLAAAYRTALAAPVAEALAAGEQRLRAVVGAFAVRWLSEDQLLDDPIVRSADPLLTSYTNVNDPGDLARARDAYRD